MGKAYPGRLIFDHMPKTAGQAINDWLATALGTAIVSPTLGMAHRAGIKRHGGEYSVISAHVYFEDTLGLDPRYQYITCLREPVERCLSWLYFIANNHETTASALRNDVQLFLASDGGHYSDLLRGQMNNLYVNHFCAIDGHVGGTDRARVEQAMNAAKRYDIVGFYEDLSRFVADTATLLGIAIPPKLPVRNSTRSKPPSEAVSSALRERLIQINTLDIDFFESMKAQVGSRNSEPVATLVERRWDKYDKPRTEAPMGGIARIIGSSSLERATRGSAVVFEIELCLLVNIDDLVIGLRLMDQNGDEAFGITNRRLGVDFGALERGVFKATFRLLMELPAGSYTASFSLHRDHRGGAAVLLDRLSQASAFRVESDALGLSSGYATMDAAMALVSTSVTSDDAVVRSAVGSLTLNSQIGVASVAEEFKLSVTVTNESAEAWVGNAHVPIFLSYHWLTADGKNFVFDGLRSPVPPTGIAAGQRLDAEVAVITPAQVGRYQLVLTLVQEHVQWLESLGFVPCRVHVDVQDSRVNSDAHSS